MKIYFFLILSFFISSKSIAQDSELEIDSLFSVIKKDNILSQNKVLAYDKLCDIYLNIDVKKVEKINNLLFLYSKKHKSYSGIGLFHMNKSKLLILRGNYQYAYLHAKKASSIFLNQHENENYLMAIKYLTHALTNLNRNESAITILLTHVDKYKLPQIADLHYLLAANYGYTEKYQKSFYHLEKAILIYKKNQNIKGIIKCYVQMSTIYFITGDYKNSIKYLEDVLPMFNNNNASIDLKNTVFYNLGLSYNENRNFKNALYYAKKSMDINNKNNLRSRIMETNLLLADIYISLNEYKKAFYILNRKYDDYYFINLNKLLGRYYYEIKDYKKSLLYFNKSYDYLSKNHDFQYKASYFLIYKQLALVKYELGMYKDAYNDYKKFEQFNTEYLSKERESRVHDIQVFFDVKEKDSRLKTLNLEKNYRNTQLRIQQNYITFGSILLALSVIISILFFVFYRLIKQKSELLFIKNAQIEENNRDLEKAQIKITESLIEKNILLKEIHHRVKNNLQLVISLLNIQGRQTNKVTIEEFLEKGQTRIAAMALIHQNLYQTDDLNKVNFQDYLTTLVNNISETYREINDDIKINIKANSNRFDIQTAIPLALIINELVSNIFKHAFPVGYNKNNQAIIEIKIKKEIDNSYVLYIQDNGIGMPKKKDVLTSSLGLQLVNLLVLQLNGSMSINDSIGVAYKIIFKDIQFN